MEYSWQTSPYVSPLSRPIQPYVWLYYIKTYRGHFHDEVRQHAGLTALKYDMGLESVNENKQFPASIYQTIGASWSYWAK